MLFKLSKARLPSQVELYNAKYSTVIVEIIVCKHVVFIRF